MKRLLPHLRILFCLMMSACLPTSAATSTERQVVINGADGVHLAGTLELPARAANSKVPALLLLAGSGPTDRNGNQPPLLITDLLRQIAHGLADHGIASLRFDKRGMDANSGELPKNRSGYSEFFSWENFVGDSAAAYRFLREQPEIDSSHAGILGHSEGGLLALSAANILKAKNQSPAVLILVSTPGRPVDVLLMEQIQGLLKIQGANPDQTQYFLSENHRIMETIRGTGQVPPDVPAGLAALYPSYLGKFLSSELAVDPSKLASEFPNPVFLLIGAADRQVSPEKDATALDQALKSRPVDDHLLVIIRGASHNLKIVHSPSDPAFAGPMAPEALDKLEAWASTKLAGPSKPAPSP
jgi:dienelactone hydrolase